VTDRSIYHAAYYQANKAALRPSRRINQKAYRRRHATAIKVAECLGVPIARARQLLEERT
jgi:hypothetical protein